MKLLHKYNSDMSFATDKIQNNCSQPLILVFKLGTGIPRNFIYCILRHIHKQTPVAKI